MKGFRRPWVLYALGLTLGLGAMAWITAIALRTERAEQAARIRSVQEEKVRLALWRMDSTMALFLSPEAARPWTDYEAFRTADGQAAPMQPHRRGLALLPSPLLTGDDPMVLLRFQIDELGRFSSPMLPPPEWVSLAARSDAISPRRSEVEARLVELQRQVEPGQLRTAMERHGAALLSRDQVKEILDRRESGGHGARNAGSSRVFQSSWTPFWMEGRLLMARQVWAGEHERLQICWLDWKAFEEVLLSTVRDFLPEAELQAAESPMETGPRKDLTGRLSAIPVLLRPGSPARVPLRITSASKAALIAGWTFALLGALAGGIVLVRATVMSERRGAFASAVAHELRTPLTTFRLYTELLAHGMVKGEEEQRELHQTLLEEADRLDHLVKNVLAYARLDARRGVNLEEVRAGELLDRLGPRLAERARQAGMELVRDEAQSLHDLAFRSDPLVVEQILFNLVDNACKYAVNPENRSIRLEVEYRGESLFLRVRDQGPGIPASERKRLFRPFQKLGPKEARSAPGVGLGLALCKRLAQLLNGDLVYEEGIAGACFALRLPVVE